MKSRLADNPLRAMPRAEAVRIAAEFLRSEGWRCLEEPLTDGEHAKVAELARRFVLSPTAVTKRLQHPHRPPCQMKRGDTGRLISVELTPDLVAWMERPKQQSSAS